MEKFLPWVKNNATVLVHATIYAACILILIAVIVLPLRETVTIHEVGIDEDGNYRVVYSESSLTSKWTTEETFLTVGGVIAFIEHANKDNSGFMEEQN